MRNAEIEMRNRVEFGEWSCAQGVLSAFLGSPV